jgi:23S rRNA pseudouridine1911/1915/1917 synthase
LIISSHIDLSESEDIQEASFLESGAADALAEVREILVQPEFHGQRLDKMLAATVPEFSRSYLQQLLEDGAVTRLGSSCTKSSTKVKAGEIWAIELRATPQSQAFKPESMELQVIYEDQYLRIIDKPAGLVVHPAPGNWSGTLMNGLLGLDSALLLLPRAGIVHRLDKDTSGLMVVARTRQAMDGLVNLIAAREVKRQYLAITDKAWIGSKQKSIDLPIGRDPSNRLRMAPFWPNARLYSGRAKPSPLPSSLASQRPNNRGLAATGIPPAPDPPPLKSERAPGIIRHPLPASPGVAG